MLVLDTNVLARRELLEWLRKTETEAVLPAVAYMEAAYHVLKKQQPLEHLDRALAAAGIRVAPFDGTLAAEAAQAAAGRWDFAKKARDYAIGAHARGEGRTLVT
ncbi:MAG: PIN domain-containing protein, partial [Euryarchaeota archaeon]|nr:PIN domain-containing protein [Euryarchaeota archaeon]